jgi:hypothetical protein
MIGPLPCRHRRKRRGSGLLAARCRGLWPAPRRFPSITRSWSAPRGMAVPLDQRLVGSGRLGHAVAGRGTRMPMATPHRARSRLDCRDSYLRSESDGMQLVGLGLEGIVAVAMPDAVLVADKSRAQDVKAVVDTLRAAEVAQADDYPRFSPALGLVRDAVPGHAVPGEAHHGQARRRPEPAKPSPPLRALDRGRRHGRGDHGRGP